MALSMAFTKLGALLDDTSNDNDVLSRLKKLASEWLSNGWKEWQVVRDDRTDDYEVDQQTLNKLRFALPTVGVAKAFKPYALSLMERSYRDMKVQMLTWSFCRGLVISPPELAIKIRGSALQHELVSQAIAPLKHLFILRKEACMQLSEDQSDEEELSRKRRRSSSVTSSKKSRLDDLESRQERIEELLQELVERKQRDEEGSLAEEEGEEELQISGSDRETTLPQSVMPEWQAPSLWTEKENLTFNFQPSTKEQDPTVPNPTQEMSRQGADCQRLGTSAWNKIRYLEAQKKIQAGGVFNQLKSIRK